MDHTKMFSLSLLLMDTYVASIFWLRLVRLLAAQRQVLVGMEGCFNQEAAAWGEAPVPEPPLESLLSREGF